VIFGDIVRLRVFDFYPFKQKRSRTSGKDEDPMKRENLKIRGQSHVMKQL
jgi:hypothetical protein